MCRSCPHNPLLAPDEAVVPPDFLPVMGWNNCQLDCGPVEPNDALVRAAALQLNALGLAAAGYTHLNLDGAWMGERASDGRPTPNATRFPDWNATLAFVRDQGLRLGLHTAAGTTTCSGRPGSCGHEAVDAEQFVRWGIAHVKDDACSVCRDASVKGASSDYAAMAAGLQAAATAHGVPRPVLMVEGQWKKQFVEPPVDDFLDSFNLTSFNPHWT